MQELTADQLKEMLNVPVIKGTPEQIHLLAIRVGELSRLNGRDWVLANAHHLLDQWDRVLSCMTPEQENE